MRITIALLVVATIGATVSHSTDLPHNATSEQEEWTPVQHPAAMTSKQDGAEQQQQQYLDPNQQILVIAPGREPGAAYPYQLPARGEVINTPPLPLKDGSPQPPNQGAVNSHAMLQPAGSGVVLQIHPQYLKGYPTNQNVQSLKPPQGNVGHGYNRNPQVAGTEVALQIQPQFVLTGVHNPGGGLHKHIQAPLYYNNQALNSAPVTLNYNPNHLLGGARPQVTPHNPAVLAQLAAAQYPQLFPANQHVRVQNHPLGTPKAPLPQHLPLTATTPAETKVRPHTRDTSSDEIFPDFGKMFESYFKTGGPFGQSFRNDIPENVQETNLKINTNDDFPTGDFFGDPDKSKAASNIQKQKQQQQNDDGFQPCDFFKAANQKVVENDSGEDSEQFSSNKQQQQREHNHFGPPRGDDDGRTKNQRYRGNRDDDDDDDDKPRPGHSHRQEHRNHDDDDDDEEESPRQQNRHRPSQSQRSQSYRGKKESDEQSSEEDDDDSDRRRPANFHHHHQHDGRPSSQNHNSGGYHGRPSHENGGHSGKQSQENNSGEKYGRPSQGYNSGGHSGKQDHNSGNDYGRPSQNYNSGGNSGRPEHGGSSHHSHNSGRQHDGRASNPRPSSEESRPSYGHHNDDDDDEERGRPSGGQYRHGQNSNRHQQEAKPPAPPPVRTFHNYNFPPTPNYHRDAVNEKKRPPPPVKEPDTLAYYTYVTPVVGNNGVYYRSEKELISRNNTMSIQ